MKRIFLLIFCLSAANVFAQNLLPHKYYLNAAEIDIENVYISPSSIDEIRVEKNTGPGEVHMVTKQSVTFLTLDMILKNNSNLVDSPDVVYTVNDKLITDKWKVKVDASFFIKVEIKRLDKLNYLNEGQRNLIIADIQLLNEEQKPMIQIRGEEALHKN